jgi:hypothetical protein
MWWGGNGDADGGSRGNAVQCLNSPAVFFGVRRNLRPPALWLYLTSDEGASARKQPSSGPQAGFLILG